MSEALRSSLQPALSAFATKPLREASLGFFKTLGYTSQRTVVVPKSAPRAFLDLFAKSAPFDQEKALFADWLGADLLFQLTDQELSREVALFPETGISSGLLRSYIFFAVELKERAYPRGKLANLARQLNRLFPTPVMVLIKHRDLVSLAVINRRPNKLDQSKDVLGRVTLIRDIALAAPHRGHLDILVSLVTTELEHPEKKPITDFDTLHAAWEQIFNVELLNKRFYQDLANWYFWALPQVEFPADLEPDSEKRRATGLIRLLTRLIFCWFLKEKELVPDKLFHPADLAKLLKGFDPESETSSNYYHAILQNLFFATLNQRMGKDGKGQPYRVFAKDEGFLKNKATHDINNLYRYESLFADGPDAALALFADVPFLNGGLFECLDRTEDGTEKKRYLDGFSRNSKKRPHVPDRLFFDSGETADLTEAYGDKKRKAEHVTGLIHILNRYKFTIVENTPIDQEIALDPELLGKVFENLLASYNEETKTTARKQTGSFYTPRPIVDYMVDESLKAHLTRVLVEKASISEPDARAGLDLLFAYTEQEHPFTASEVAILIAAIDALKILDPACGSGAFPMGMLHKLVYILQKLDHGNERWKETQLAKLDSPAMREELERAFAENNDDYGRKLSLIENCLYGVDIQPIAIQITKLRFFISLVADQKTSRDKAKNLNIKPLPNLETKFVAANTLIGLPISDKDLFIESIIAPIEKEIEDAYHSHFTIQRRDQKLALQKKIKALRQKLADTLAVSLGSVNSKKAKHLSTWDPFDPQATADFFDPHWMFGRSLKNGFDVIIGNPPYFNVDTLGANSPMMKLIKETYPLIWQDKSDILFYFIYKALTISKGNVSFIVSNAFLFSDKARKLRNYILEDGRLSKIVNFEKLMVFESALITTCILLFTKGKKEKNEVQALSLKDQDYDAEVFRNHITNPSNYTSVKFREDSVFALVDSETDKLNQIIDGKHSKLQDLIVMGQGMQTGENDVFCFESQPKQFPSRYVRRRIDGRNISRYSISDEMKYLLYIEDIENFEDLPKSIQNYLNEHYAALSSRADKKRRATAKWWNYTFSLHREKYHLPKIWCSYRGKQNAFALDETGECVGLTNTTVIFDTNRNYPLKYLLGLLNSRILTFRYRSIGKQTGGGIFEFFANGIGKLPIPSASAEQQATIIALVSCIMSAKRLGETIIADFADHLIDACVFELYFREHMAERDLLFHDLVAPHLAAYDPAASETRQRDFLTHLHATLNAPSHPIRNRLLRLTADSPDLLAVIKTESRA